MTHPALLWLNCDAEREFDGTLGEATQRSSARRIALLEDCAQRIAATWPGTPPALLHPGMDPVACRRLVDGLAPGARADAWCPTARARDALGALGFAVDAPDDSVLARVNHRAFCAELDSDAPGLPGERFCRSVREVEDCIAEDRTRSWLLKRPFGFSGRARKCIAEGAERDASVQTWIEASMRGYGAGLQVEPFVEIVEDFAIHGRLARDGTHSLLRISDVRTDAKGAWSETRARAWSSIDAHERDLLEYAALDVAAALAKAGYYGPFGIDAFAWVDDAGARRIRPRSEINARYTMGWWRSQGGAANS